MSVSVSHEHEYECAQCVYISESVIITPLLFVRNDNIKKCVEANQCLSLCCFCFANAQSQFSFFEKEEKNQREMVEINSTTLCNNKIVQLLTDFRAHRSKSTFKSKFLLIFFLFMSFFCTQHIFIHSCKCRCNVYYAEL